MLTSLPKSSLRTREVRARCRGRGSARCQCRTPSRARTRPYRQPKPPASSDVNTAPPVVCSARILTAELQTFSTPCFTFAIIRSSIVASGPRSARRRMSGPRNWNRALLASVSGGSECAAMQPPQAVWPVMITGVSSQMSDGAMGRREERTVLRADVEHAVVQQSIRRHIVGVEL